MIDENGKNLGVLPTSEALRLANERGFDLIEIAPGVAPPVCKIMDYGKFRYERERGEREHGKKQKEVGVKGIRIGFKTGVHDLKLRASQARKFLEDGDKVRVQIRLAGREKAHPDVALKKFNEFLDMVAAVIPIALELPPKKLPQGFIAIIAKK